MIDDDKDTTDDQEELDQEPEADEDLDAPDADLDDDGEDHDSDAPPPSEEPELDPAEAETLERLVAEHIPDNGETEHRLSRTLLPVDRARDQLLELAEEQATLELEVERLEEQKRETAKHYKGRIDAKRQRIRELAHDIDNGAQDELVPTVSIADFTAKEMRVFRLDTGDLVEERTLTADELQSDMFPEG